jgi:hypothetical protein
VQLNSEVLARGARKATPSSRFGLLSVCTFELLNILNEFEK